MQSGEGQVKSHLSGLLGPVTDRGSWATLRSGLRATQLHAPAPLSQRFVISGQGAPHISLNAALRLSYDSDKPSNSLRPLLHFAKEGGSNTPYAFWPLTGSLPCFSLLSQHLDFKVPLHRPSDKQTA